MTEIHRPTFRPLAWLGIGAQRCGTSWFIDLFSQHPEVSLGTSRQKELHLASRILANGWSTGLEDEYAAEFPVSLPGACGEFTPAYLRLPYLAPLVRDNLLAADAPAFVLLRDPIDRFRSAMDLYYARAGGAPENEPALRAWARDRGSDAVWAGMYASQLHVWRQVLGKRRIRVYVYEEMRKDPAAIVEDAWSAVGLEPVPIRDVSVASMSTVPRSEWKWEQLAGGRASLAALYRPEVVQLGSWGIDTSAWSSFQ